MSRSASLKQSQSRLPEKLEIVDGQWFDAWGYELHECCDCGLTHKVRKRIYHGRYQEQWNVDPAETRKARRARKKA